MNEIKKSLILRFLTGLILGMIIGAIILIVSGELNDSYRAADTGEVIKCLVSCGLYGAICTCAMILYKIDSISLVYATAIHFLTVMAGLYVLGLILGWDFNDTMIFAVFISYMIIFIVSWIIIFLAGKRKVTKMNEDLQQWKAYRSGFRKNKTDNY